MPNHPSTYQIFWDGECRFCQRSLSWALSRDSDKLLVATPYQQVPDPPMDPVLTQACRHAVHLQHPDGQLERAGRACLTIIELIGYRRLARWGRKRPLIWAIELGYGIVAHHRRLFSRLFFRC